MKNIVRCSSKEEVFAKYLQVANGLVRPENRLTAREVEVLSYICTQDPRNDQLVGTGLQRVLQKFPKISKSHIGVLKSSLRGKGWLQENGLIVAAIRNQLEVIYNNPLPYTEISLNLTFTSKTVEHALQTNSE